MKKSTPLRTLWKNWPVFAGLIITFLLWRWDAFPVMLRAVVQVPMYLFLALGCYLILRSVFCRSTTDALGDDATALEKDWDALPPGGKVKLLIFERVGFLIAAAIIIAGLLIIYGGASGAAAALQ